MTTDEVDAFDLMRATVQRAVKERNALYLACCHALEALEHHSEIKHPQQRVYRDQALAMLREALGEEA